MDGRAAGRRTEANLTDAEYANVGVARSDAERAERGESKSYLFIGEVYVFMDEDIAVRGARRARRAPRGA